MTHRAPYPRPRLRPGLVRTALVLATGAAAFSGCATTAKSSGPPPGTIVVRSPQEPDGLNPFLTGMSAANDACQPIFSGLLAVDDKMKFVPDLATEVPTPKNGSVVAVGKGMVVTYKLRKGVTWHDGKPFTSKDVAFTAKCLADPTMIVVERDGYDLIDKVETPDDYTVKVHFKQIFAPYLKLFKAILPAHRLEASKDKNKDPFNQAPVGTGPFMFASWRSGDRLTYKAYPKYWRGKAAFETLEFRIVPDDNAAFVQLKNGSVDVYQSVNLAQFKTLKHIPGVKIHQTPAMLWEHLSFNTEKPYFQDARVRRAIAHAIDKKVLSDKVYDGLWKPAWSDQNPLSWAYAPELVEKVGFDPAKAEQLLDEAGWKRGSDGVRTKDGLRFEVFFATTAGKKNRETAQLLIRHFLRRIGIEVKLENHPGVSLFGAWPGGVIKSGKFDMAMWAWDTGPDPDNFNTWHSGRIPPKGSNQTRYKNPELDKLLEASTKTFNQDERQVIYKKISAILVQEAPNVPLLYWTVLDAVRDRVEGFRPNPTNAGNLWNTYEWKIKDGAR